MGQTETKLQHKNTFSHKHTHTHTLNSINLPRIKKFKIKNNFPEKKTHKHFLLSRIAQPAHSIESDKCKVKSANCLYINVATFALCLSPHSIYIFIFYPSVSLSH